MAVYSISVGGKEDVAWCWMWNKSALSVRQRGEIELSR